MLTVDAAVLSLNRTVEHT